MQKQAHRYLFRIAHAVNRIVQERVTDGVPPEILNSVDSKSPLHLSCISCTPSRLTPQVDIAEALWDHRSAAAWRNLHELKAVRKRDLSSKFLRLYGILFHSTNASRLPIAGQCCTKVYTWQVLRMQRQSFSLGTGIQLLSSMYDRYVSVKVALPCPFCWIRQLRASKTHVPVVMWKNNIKGSRSQAR